MLLQYISFSNSYLYKRRSWHGISISDLCINFDLFLFRLTKVNTRRREKNRQKKKRGELFPDSIIIYLFADCCIDEQWTLHVLVSKWQCTIGTCRHFEAVKYAVIVCKIYFTGFATDKQFLMSEICLLLACKKLTMFLAYHDSVMATCWLQVKNTVIVTRGKLPWSQRVRQSTQASQCSWCILAAW